MSGYPKLIWVNGVERTVHSEAEELAALAPAPPAVEPDVAEVAAADLAALPYPPAYDGTDGHDEEGPTFGPPGDDTHAKRARKKR